MRWFLAVNVARGSFLFPFVSLLPLFAWYAVLLTLLQALGNFCGHREVQAKLPAPPGDPALCGGPWMRLALKARISSPSCLLFETSAALGAVLTTLFSSLPTS